MGVTAHVDPGDRDRGRAAGGAGGSFEGAESLRPVDRATAELATALSRAYRLKAADATHLATAVGMGAGRFITSNRRDFGADIKEIDVTYPDALSDPGPDPAG